MSVQPAELVTSPQGGTVILPRRSLLSRQGNAGVIAASGVGSPSVVVACGRNVTIKMELVDVETVDAKPAQN